MLTTCNPGRWLEVRGSFGVLTNGDRVVFDRESGTEITLHGLLRSFLMDPDETVTGPIKITIEASSR